MIQEASQSLEMCVEDDTIRCGCCSSPAVWGTIVEDIDDDGSHVLSVVSSCDLHFQKWLTATEAVIDPRLTKRNTFHIDQRPRAVALADKSKSEFGLTLGVA